MTPKDPFRLVAVVFLAFGLPSQAEETAPSLGQWKLTLPLDENGDGRADEIVSKSLSTFRKPPLFDRVDAKWTFRAPCGGATTKGSRYPRCELREMMDGDEADWSTDDSRHHILTARLAVTALPAKKPHVVCAQIHDSKDDVLMLRVEGKKLLIERNRSGDVVIDRQYELGTPFDLRIDAGGGHIRVEHNSREVLNWETRRQHCYFKAGCYTQSNPSQGDAADSFGEVVIEQLAVESR